MVQGIVCSKLGPWREVLKFSKDIEKDYPQLSFKVPNGCAKVSIAAAGVCFPDVLIVEGKHMFERPAPFVPCVEISGTIIELNATPKSNPHGFKVGDKIFGTSFMGTLCSEAVCALDRIYKVPDGVDLKLVAGFEVNYGTTYHALIDSAEVKSGETMLVLGASGGVGMTAIDLGKALGMRVVAAASTEEKLAACKKAGADVLLNYSKKSLKDCLKDENLYGKIDIVYDPVGGDLSEQAIRAMSWGGRFIMIGFAAGGNTPKNGIPNVPLNLALLNERKIVGSLFQGWTMRDQNKTNRKNMGIMMQMVADGKLKPVVSKEYSFSEFYKAFEDIMGRKVIGKVIVTPIKPSANL